MFPGGCFVVAMAAVACFMRRRPRLFRTTITRLSLMLRLLMLWMMRLSLLRLARPLLTQVFLASTAAVKVVSRGRGANGVVFGAGLHHVRLGCRQLLFARMWGQFEGRKKGHFLIDGF